MELSNGVIPKPEIPFEINSSQLKQILENGVIINEQDTFISGHIRMIKYGQWYVFQEKSLKQEIMVRFFINEDNAMKLFNNRLDIYEKMWNGCGCKVDYYK